MMAANLIPTVQTPTRFKELKHMIGNTLQLAIHWITWSASRMATRF